MSESYHYHRLGADKDAAPTFEPYARGLLILLSREIDEDQFLSVNLHAQAELMAENADFAAAKAYWDNLPHTPARQLENGGAIVDPVSEADEFVGEWLAQYDNLEGASYAFDISRRLNLATGETEPRIPELMEISFGMGGMSMQPFDAATEKDCVEYRAIYVFAEKA